MNQDKQKFCKLDNGGYVIFPPHWDSAEPGIMNPHLNEDYLARHGYEEHTTEWIAEHQRPAIVSAADYDNALEAHLAAEREARGYTTREPDYYIHSGVAKWKQDALDWAAHRDAVMLYGLQVENDYSAGLPVPTLDEFKAALPTIEWTIEVTNE